MLEMTAATDEPGAPEAGHYLWAYFRVYVDPGKGECEIIPVRLAGIHWNILRWLEQGPCTDCFKITGFAPSGHGTLLVDIEITHPFDNPNLTGFDVRGIAMFNASHTFPAKGLTTSNPVLGDGALVNADGCTTLYNWTTEGSGPGGLQGYIKGKFATEQAPDSLLNGYKRHISADPANTRNAFYAGDSVTVTYEIDMPDGAFVFGYAVDASWAPPIEKPVDDPMTDFGPDANCPEPWKIEVMEMGPGLTDQGGSTKLVIDVYDWQGKDSHFAPVLECAELFTGSLTAAWKEDGPSYARYEVTIGNQNLAPEGEYLCLVAVEDNENLTAPDWLDLTSYQVHTLEVELQSNPNPFDPIDVTPPSLEIDDACHVGISGGYAYVSGGEGFYATLFCVDITPPESANIINTLEAGGFNTRAFSGGYAFSADWYQGLHIIDISEPGSEYIIKTVETDACPEDVAVSGDYAFVVCEHAGNNLEIIDINPPESAYLYKSIAWPPCYNSYGVDVSGGYAFVADDDGLEIIDIDPIADAALINTVNISYGAEDVVVANGYAYLSTWGHTDAQLELVIIDVSDPETADESDIIQTVELPGLDAGELVVSAGYAYVASYFAGVQIVDIDPPNEASFVISIPTPSGHAEGVAVSGNYLFVGDTLSFRIIKLW